MRSDETVQIKALLIDDDDFTRLLLSSTLKDLGYAVVADAATAADAIKAATDHEPDLAIIDLDLGEGPTGIDVAHGLRRILPGIALVMLSSYEEPRLIKAKQLELPEGTVYVVKKVVGTPEILEKAISSALNQEGFTSVVVEEDNKVKRVSRLSDSQVEIMRLVASGYTNAAIAKRQFLTEASVGKAVARLIRQLNVAASEEQNQRVLIAQAYYESIGPSTLRRG